MADNSQSSTMEYTVSSAASPGSPKKVVSTKAMELKAKSRPRTSEMVVEAIREIGERDGSSLFAIKKYITLIYKVDTDKQANSIKKYLRAAVASGELVQTRGKGASGSFKLPSDKSQTVNRKESKLVDAEGEKNEAETKSSKTDSAKLSSSTKKLASSKVTKKESSATGKSSKTAKSALPKSSKAKKLARSPTTKPKAPKPKKVGAGV